METWAEIRRRVLVEKVSRRQILRETGMHWQTLREILHHSEPPGYRQSEPRARKKLGAYEGRIEQILKEDQGMPRKQRHTAKRIWERLRSEGFTGGYTIVIPAEEAVKSAGEKYLAQFGGSDSALFQVARPLLVRHNSSTSKMQMPTSNSGRTDRRRAAPA